MKLTRPFFVVLAMCTVVLGGCFGPAPEPPKIIRPALTRAELQAKIQDLEGNTAMPAPARKALLGSYKQQLAAMPATESVGTKAP